MFLWTCFVSETVVILYDMRSRTTIYIMKKIRVVYNFCKFLLFVDILISFFLVLFVFFFSQLSNRPHFLEFVW